MSKVMNSPMAWLVNGVLYDRHTKVFKVAVEGEDVFDF